MPDHYFYGEEIGEELERIQDILDDAQATTRISEWEEEFLDNLRSRVRTYGPKTRVTDKQRDIIDRIERKLYAE